ncbi:MAG: M61 family metallopeptidase [Pseudomonadales bacterium]|nr:M61 family metallopeptidase [Pseudomonadales bacterium]
MLVTRATALLLVCSLLSPAQAQRSSPPVDQPYPGTIELEVDATNVAQHIFNVKQTVPVRPGQMTFLFPAWLPGNHSPSGRIDKLAGLTIEAAGQKLAWRRDPLDVYAFAVAVPAGVPTLTMRYQFLSPTDKSQGRVVMTPDMLNLQWNAVVLYPAGHYASQIQYAAMVTYPADWQAATALTVVSRDGNTLRYAPVALDVLVDSPVFAGRYFKRYDLAPGANVPIRLNVVADAPRFLEAKPSHLQQHVKLVQQTIKLFGAQHYDHYDFLFALSDHLSGIGLEHQRSSENGVPPGYFSDWQQQTGSTDLLAHEYTHSWNGKFRRPADLWTPNYNVPMQDSLLWVYEGQTQYWGNVLAARSGLRPLEASREALALVAATYRDDRPGLAWRSVEDTTNDPIIAQRRPKPYRNWQLSEDYYSAGQLIWLDVDAQIRKLSRGKKSLDDFARAFFGVDDGAWQTQKPYTFDDVVTTLNAVVPHDWAPFLRDRLDGRTPLTNGLEASGWRLVYRDTPSAYAQARAKEDESGSADFIYSLGFTVDKDGAIGDVRWDSPAFKAGIGSDNKLVAVNDLEYNKDTLNAAIKAAVLDAAPLRLLVKESNRYRSVTIDYHDGPRYPYIERIDGAPDYLSAIFAAK